MDLTFNTDKICRLDVRNDFQTLSEEPRPVQVEGVRRK